MVHGSQGLGNNWVVSCRGGYFLCQGDVNGLNMEISIPSFEQGNLLVVFIGLDFILPRESVCGVDRKMGVVPTYRRVPKSSS